MDYEEIVAGAAGDQIGYSDCVRSWKQCQVSWGKGFEVTLHSGYVTHCIDLVVEEGCAYGFEVQLLGFEHLGFFHLLKAGRLGS